MKYLFICHDDPPVTGTGTGTQVITDCSSAQLVEYSVYAQPMELDHFLTIAPEVVFALVIATGFRWLRKLIWR